MHKDDSICNRARGYAYVNITRKRHHSILYSLKVKVKYLRGAFGGAGHLSDQIFHAPGAKLWHYAAKLRTLSVHFLCVAWLLLTPRIILLRCAH